MRFILLLSLLFSLGLSASTRTVRTGKYLYFVTPFSELSNADKIETLLESKLFIETELQRLFPAESDRPESINELRKESENIDELLHMVGEYLQNDPPGVTTYDLIPSGYMLVLGGGFTKRFVWQFSGSFNIGLVIMPTRVKRISLAHPEEQKSYTTFEASLVFLPVGNVKILKTLDGEAGLKKTSFRAGIGLIFGEMNTPSDFFGVAAGLSLSAKAHRSFQIKALGVVNNRGPLPDLGGMKFLLLTFTSRQAQEWRALDLHVNIGFIKPLANFMRAYESINMTMSPDTRAFLPNESRSKQIISKIILPHLLSKQDSAVIQHVIDKAKLRQEMLITF